MKWVNFTSTAFITEATIIPEFNGKAYIRLAGPAGEQSLRKRRMRLELILLRKKEEGMHSL